MTSLQAAPTPTFAGLLEQYLRAYWLRPVTALVRALEASTLELWTTPTRGSVDLACGDGLNSFLARGGELPLEVDAFLSLPIPDAASFFGGRVDVYDRDERKDDLLGAAAPQPLWGLGVDHKQNLLNKAGALGSYERLLCHDLNQPLPLPDGSASFVFSNSLYWLVEVDQVCAELARVLEPAGQACLLLASNSFRDHMAWSKLEGWSFRDQLDMGRHSHYQSLLPPDEWERKLVTAGLEIVRRQPCFNSSLVHMVEFHDYREISPITAFMSRQLAPDALRLAKRHWIDYARHQFLRMHEEGFFEATADDSHYTIFWVRKA